MMPTLQFELLQNLALTPKLKQPKFQFNQWIEWITRTTY